MVLPGVIFDPSAPVVTAIFVTMSCAIWPEYSAFAPLFAIAIGVLITNAIPAVSQAKSLRLGELSKLCLKGGIILLGASLDLNDIVQTGVGSLPLLAVTMASGLICALWLGK